VNGAIADDTEKKIDKRWRRKAVALFGCTQAPPPPAQKQAQEKTQPQQKKDYSQPHTAWAP
jgi:hypothetical protein